MAEAIAIRLMVENGNVVRAELKGIGEAGQKSLDKVADGAKRASRELDGLGVGSLNAATAIKTLASALSGYMALQAARYVVELSDSYKNLQTKLDLATGSTAAAATAQRELFKIAQETRAPLDDTVRTYQRLAPAFREAGVAAEDEMNIMRTLNQSMLASGSTAGEASSAMLQFAQAMGKGRLNGDELRSMMENWPSLMRRIAEAFGVPMGTLTQLGEEGRITAQKLIEALQVMESEIAADAAKVQTTFEQSQTQLRNEIEQSLGKIVEQSGATNVLVDAMDDLRKVISGPEFAEGATAIANAIIAALEQTKLLIEDLSFIIQIIKDLKALDAASASAAKDLLGDRFGAAFNDSPVAFGQEIGKWLEEKAPKLFANFMEDGTKSVDEVNKGFDELTGKAWEAYKAVRATGLAFDAAQKPNFAGIGNFRDAQDLDTQNRERAPGIWGPVARPEFKKRVELDPGKGSDKAAKAAAKALEDAAKQYQRNEDVINDLLKKMGESADERDQFIAGYVDKLNAFATDEQIADLKEYAAIQYDINQLKKQQGEREEYNRDLVKQALALNKEHLSAAEQFKQKMQELDRLREVQANGKTVLSDDAYRAEAKKASESASEVQKAYMQQTDAAQKHYKQIEQFANMAFQGISSGLAEMLVQGEWNIESFLEGIAEKVIEMGIQQMLMQLFGMAMGGAMGSTGTLALNSSGTGMTGGWQYRHGGGVVGVDQPYATRSLPASLLIGAPRLHSGYLANDEYPTILQRGESVLTPAQMRQMGNSGTNVNVEINNYSGEKVTAEQTGGGNIKVIVGQLVAASMMDRGSPANRAVQEMIKRSNNGR